MASTFTTNTGIEKIGDGEQTGLWGQTTNLNFDIVDRALNGVLSIPLTTTSFTLTTSSGTLSDGQAAAIVFTGSIGGPATITISPNTAEKTYIIRNESNQSITITQGSGGDVTIPAGGSTTVACTGEGATAQVFEVGITEVDLTTNVTGTLPVANGGTGRNTITSGAIVLGNGTGLVNLLAGSSAGQVPRWDGSTWAVSTEDLVVNSLTLGRGGGNDLTNTAIGYRALRDNTTGDDNTAVGSDTLRSNIGGDSNTAVGQTALVDNTTGNFNTATGVQALTANTTGIFNVANGVQTLRLNTTGSSNTAVGMEALFNNSTGSNNIGLGRDAGKSTSPLTITTQSNQIVIGNDDHTAAFIKIAFTVTSDERDKAAFAPIPHGLSFVTALQPTEYQFKAGGRDGTADGKRRYGFRAQDVLAVEGANPVIVNDDDPDKLKMTHDYLIPVLVNAVKELSTQVSDLQAEVTALKGQ
jgi:hypothetical protein